MSIENNLKDYLYMFKGHVKHVVDGDSLDVNIDHGMRVNSLNRLRLLGLDTPERGENGYLEAKSFVFEKVMDKDVIVKTYKSDVFGRYLAVVYYEDEMGEIHNLNQELIDRGLLKPNSKWNDN